jgi:A/G-specific adenine glycosylase
MADRPIPPDQGPAPGSLAGTLIDWQRTAGRHDLPWQRTRDPYRIWVSEIMLQQTQVSTVLGYYERFLASFPDVATLAAAPPDEVLRHWSGLGYYSRARNLHAAARAVVGRHGGVFPVDPRALEALPGIGRSTAAAIAAFSSGARVPILDGNVKRVFCRVFGIEGFPGERAVEQRLWAIAEREMPEPGEGRVETWTQGLMDLGATVCVRTRPRCEACPAAGDCVARRLGRTGTLPTPRPVRTVPIRDAEWVVLRAGAAVLLERRPGSGLWGGLWSVPERVAPGADAPPGGVDPVSLSAWVADRFGIAVRQVVPFGRVRHAFTHFRLRARVWQVDVDPGEAAREAPAGHLWLALDGAADAPLPRPVKTLLEGLAAPLA